MAGLSLFVLLKIYRNELKNGEICTFGAIFSLVCKVQHRPLYCTLQKAWIIAAVFLDWLKWKIFFMCVHNEDVWQKLVCVHFSIVMQNGPHGRLLVITCTKECEAKLQFPEGWGRVQTNRTSHEGAGWVFYWKKTVAIILCTSVRYACQCLTSPHPTYNLSKNILLSIKLLFFVL